jgi:transcriptional regulator
MHPNKIFAWEDRIAMLRFVGQRSFAHIFTAAKEGLFVVHAPLLVTAGGKIWFHVARRNRITPHLAGRNLLLSVAGRDAYQSANWYVSDNQVPTWHYETVEIQGPARELADSELVELLDCLSEVMEGRYSPEAPWTRAKMEPGKFEAMLRAIVGFEVDPVEMRGTRKFNQHKGEADLTATIAGQVNVGRGDIVAAIDEVRIANE